MTTKAKPYFKPRPAKTKSGRQPEKWFRVFLWIVSFIFAGFLIGLGSKVVADLPMITTHDTTLEDFVADRPAYDKLKSERNDAESQKLSIDHEWEQKATNSPLNKTPIPTPVRVLIIGWRPAL